MMKKRILVLMLLGSVVVGSMVGCGNQGKTESEKFPSDDITVIVPKAAGGGTDISTRGLVQYMQEEMEDSNFVVTNKPDGGGVTGMVEVANAEPDGYTIGMVTVELAMFPHQDKSPVTYEDFAAISSPIAAPAALIVPADAPYDSIEEFAAYAKDNEIQVGNSGAGAIWHIAAIAFEEEFGVTFNHIPYPNGTADIAAAITGKHIEATFADPSSFKSQVEAGELKILGLMADERSELYPDAPTFKEEGYDITIRAWACLVAPKDTPEEVLEVLRAAAKSATENEEYIEYFVQQGIDPVTIIGEDCETMMEEDHKLYEEMLEKVE